MGVNCLREFTDSKDVRPLFENVEDLEGNTVKQLYIEGPFLQGDVVNRNGRVYPVDMLQSSIGAFKKSKMKGVGVPGELNHPESSIQVDLDRVSHYITHLEMVGKDGIGKAKIASTPTGQIAKCLINDGMILGVSTRGVGRLGEDAEGRKVVSDFELVTVDIVSEPSAPNAFVNAVMEGLEYYLDENDNRVETTLINELMEKFNLNVATLPKKKEDRNKKLFAEINAVLSALS
jgi:hypothetical protein